MEIEILQPKFNWQEMKDNGHCVNYIGHMKDKYNKPIETVVWDCRISDMLDIVHTNPDKRYPYNQARWQELKNISKERIKKWQQIPTEEAIDRVDWPEGLKYMDQYVCDLQSGPMSSTFRRIRVWGEDGDDFCRDRFDAGDVDCWRTMKRDETHDYKSGVIEMTVAFGGNCNKTAEQLIWGGAAASLLIDKLEDAGYRVGVTGIHVNKGLFLDGSSYYGNKPLLVHKLAVKDPDQPLDIDTLLMAIASPWFFRVHIFRSYLEMPFEVESCLGRTYDIPKQFRGKLHIDHIYNKEDAQKYLNNTVEMFEKGRSLAM